MKRERRLEALPELIAKGVVDEKVTLIFDNSLLSDLL
jgi:hypothetical protein